MKLPKTFISSFVIVAVTSMLPIFAAYGQQTGDASTGDDAHPTIDSPYLRKKKPAPSQQQQQAVSLSQKDQKFISSIAASGAAEVVDGKIAQQQGSGSVKNVASRIVNDRSQNNKELLDLAKKKGLGLGVDKIKARPWNKSNFDKQYIDTVTRDYESDIGLLQKASQSGDDKDVKAWASKTLPMMKQHLAMLKGTKGSAKAKPEE